MANVSDKKICEFIHNLCTDSDLSHAEFQKGIDEAGYKFYGDDYKEKDESTIRKWYNGKQTPGPYYYKLIATTLGVTEDEIRVGRRIEESVPKTEYDQLNRSYSTIKYFLNSFKSEYSLFGKLFVLVAIMLIDFSRIHIYIPGLICSLLIYITIKKDNDENSINGDIKISMKDVFKQIKSEYNNNEVHANVVMLYVFIFILIVIIPLLETLFYRGTYYITFTIYTLIGLILFRFKLN